MWLLSTLRRTVPNRANSLIVQSLVTVGSPLRTCAICSHQTSDLVELVKHSDDQVDMECPPAV